MTRTLKDDISNMFTHGELICDGLMVTPSILSDVTRSMPDRHGGRLKARLLRRLSVTIISLDFWRLSVRLIIRLCPVLYVVELGTSSAHWQQE